MVCATSCRFLVQDWRVRLMTDGLLTTGQNPAHDQHGVTGDVNGGHLPSALFRASQQQTRPSHIGSLVYAPRHVEVGFRT